jgi:hypothetical protein
MPNFKNLIIFIGHGVTLFAHNYIKKLISSPSRKLQTLFKFPKVPTTLQFSNNTKYSMFFLPFFICNHRANALQKSNKPSISVLLRVHINIFSSIRDEII